MGIKRRKILCGIGAGCAITTSGCVGRAARAADDVGIWVVRVLRGGARANGDNNEQNENNENEERSVEDIDIPNRTFVEVDENIQIDGQSYAFLEINLAQYAEEYDLNPELEYELTVQSGPDINAILIHEDEFESFREGEEYDYRGEASEFEVSATSKSSTIFWSDYRFILQNPHTEGVNVEIKLTV